MKRFIRITSERSGKVGFIAADEIIAARKDPQGKTELFINSRLSFLVKESPEDILSLLEAPATTLVADLWDFIENCSDDAPHRQERFFALRERVREASL